MKKILTVSLVAVMAVSAAHANIASTEYVDDKETALNAAIALKADSSTVTALDAEYKQADTALGGRIDTLSGTVTANKTVTDKTQEDLDALEETVAGLTGDSGILSGLDLAAVQSTGKAIVSVSQADGKVSASVGTISTAGIDNGAVTTDKIADANVTAAKLSTDAKALFDAAGSAAAAQAAAIAASDTKGSAAAAQAAAIEAAAADATTKAGNALTESKSYTDSKISDDAVSADKVSSVAPTISYTQDLIDSSIGGLVAQSGENKAAIEAMDLTAVQATGKAIVSVSQADGKVSASVGTIGTAGIDDSAVTTAKIANANVTAAKLSTDAKALFDAAGSAAAAQAAAIAASDSKGSAAAAQAAAIAASDSKGSAAAAQTAAIAAAKTETENQVKALADGQVATNKTGIATINTNLGPLAGVTIPAACATDAVCSLVMNKGKVAWEVVSY